MKLLFDMSSAQPENSVTTNGGGEYAFLLFKELVSKAKDTSIVVSFSGKKGKNEAIERYCNEKGINSVWFCSIEDFGNVISKSGFDTVVLPVCYPDYSRLKISDSIRLITIIHDLSSVYYDLTVKYGRYLFGDYRDRIDEAVVKRDADKICSRAISEHEMLFHLNSNQTIATVSYYTKNAMRLLLGCEEAVLSKVGVYYSIERSFDVNFSKESAVLSRYGLDSNKYFFLSSACRWTKNNAIALFTLDRMFSSKKYGNRMSDYRVIAVGSDDKNTEYYKRNIQNKEKFIFDSYVSDSALGILYKNARLFIYPSLLEGFGYPPLEAMKYGTVSACSTAMSIPEVCGDAAIYFSPDDQNSIEIAILESLEDDYMKLMKERAERHYREMSDRQKSDTERLVKMILC